jgi:hypothetical protein
MEHSNAAVARGDKRSPFGFGSGNRTPCTAFTGHPMQTAERHTIAASEDVKLMADAGFMSAVS